LSFRALCSVGLAALELNPCEREHLLLLQRSLSREPIGHQNAFDFILASLIRFLFQPRSCTEYVSGICASQSGACGPKLFIPEEMIELQDQTSRNCFTNCLDSLPPSVERFQDRDEVKRMASQGKGFGLVKPLASSAGAG
jgi:hypothetical protein